MLDLRKFMGLTSGVLALALCMGVAETAIAQDKTVRISGLYPMTTINPTSGAVVTLEDIAQCPGLDESQRSEAADLAAKRPQLEQQSAAYLAQAKADQASRAELMARKDKLNEAVAALQAKDADFKAQGQALEKARPGPDADDKAAKEFNAKAAAYNEQAAAINTDKTAVRSQLETLDKDIAAYNQTTAGRQDQGQVLELQINEFNTGAKIYDDLAAKRGICFGKKPAKK